MTLAAQDDMRRLQTPNSFERDVMKRLDEDFEPWNKSSENSPNFARACTLTIDGVVDEID